MKIEIRLAKMVLGRWGALVGDSPDREHPFFFLLSFHLQTHVTTNHFHEALAVSATTPTPTPASQPKTRKNWEGITTEILGAEKEKTTDEDPNVGGDSTLNSFFQKIFGDADDDTKRAMMKSYSESGGTTLSTNWDEVKKAKVDVKPPSGSEWKQWN